MEKKKEIYETKKIINWKMKFNQDMTFSQVQLEVGIEIAEKMNKILRGQTIEIRNGKEYFYDYDLQRAYELVVSGGCE